MLIFIILALLSPSSFAAPSAYRDPAVDYKEYIPKRPFAAKPESAKTALDSAKAYSAYRFPSVPKWSNENELNERFQRIRDTRWLEDRERPQFLRRSSWLFPDDGCFARAALAVWNLVRWNFTAPKKIFAFGNLFVSTPNTQAGTVTWWYHVAPVIQVEETRFVLDPAVEPHYPLTVEEWLERMSEEPTKIEVAVCGSGTYGPDSRCNDQTDGVESAAHQDQSIYLKMEWRRLISLSRNPEQELGDSPPWAL